ncbi:MAG TPA: (2Fe-2S)-binding protein [Thermoanaerobaculia bacterium]|nr:(2Fe-2S)-binding protein [Thermoanaerobaculia bacterium]
MIVCVCRGASERDVLNAIDHGAETIPELQRCGIGTECGSCHNMLRKMLAEARERDEVAAPAA